METFLQIFPLGSHTSQHRRPLLTTLLYTGKVWLPYLTGIQQLNRAILDLKACSWPCVEHENTALGNPCTVWDSALWLCFLFTSSTSKGFKAQPRATDPVNYKQDQRGPQSQVARSPGRSNSVRCSVKLQFCDTKSLQQATCCVSLLTLKFGSGAYTRILENLWTPS